MPILFDIRHHFNVHIKPTHPIWSSKENLERYERLYGGPIRPLDDIIEHLFLTTLLFGFKEVTLNVDEDHPERFCPEDRNLLERCQRYFRQETYPFPNKFPALMFKHEGVVCQVATANKCPTIVIGWQYDDRTLEECLHCTVSPSGERQPCTIEDMPLPLKDDQTRDLPPTANIAAVIGIPSQAHTTVDNQDERRALGPLQHRPCAQVPQPKARSQTPQATSSKLSPVQSQPIGERSGTQPFRRSDPKEGEETPLANDPNSLKDSPNPKKRKRRHPEHREGAKRKKKEKKREDELKGKEEELKMREEYLKKWKERLEKEFKHVARSEKKLKKELKEILKESLEKELKDTLQKELKESFKEITKGLKREITKSVKKEIKTSLKEVKKALKKDLQKTLEKLLAKI